jgi:hypothetical protein
MNNSRQYSAGNVFRPWSALLLLLSLTLPAFAKVGDPPPSTTHQVLPLSSVAELALPATDVQKELTVESKSKILSPYRFAVGQKVSVTTSSHGTWEKLSDGYLWRLKVSSPGATDLNLGFTTFWLPDGATLHIASTTENYYQGPYTAEDNTEHKQLWTPVVPGDSAVIELFVPASATQQVELTLSQVNGGFRDLFKRRKELTNLKSESCEVDVACPSARPWTNEVRSVARYSISGTDLCSGSLIANTSGDNRNYFLTANHCGVTVASAPTVVVYWNFQSPTCGEHGGGSLADSQSGATFRAAKYDVDFALIELNAAPDPSWNVHYTGWDRTGVAPSGGVGIHHPNADEKSISFSSNALVTVDSCVGTGGVKSHWQVTWTVGVTEPGSSGSGIWNISNHRLIGTLSGGSSDCSNLSGTDCYGQFAVAWASGTAATNRLKDWLDPLNTGATGINGYDPTPIASVAADGYSIDAESCGPPNNAIDPGETVTLELNLTNRGRADTTNLVAKLLPGGGVLLPSGSQTYGVITAGGPDVSRPFTFTASGQCGGKIIASLRLQDGTKVQTNKFVIPIGAPNPTLTFSQAFDSVTAPSLPSGWSSTASGTGASAWVTSASQSDTAPNSAFGSDSANVTDEVLVSPSFAVNSANTQVTFHHSYGLETGYDGGVLEISTNGGAFKDIISAGGSFVANGYNYSIPTNYFNPLGNRNAWSGSSGGFITTTVNLPAAAAGKNVRLRWRLGTDNSNGATGWYVDSVSVYETTYTCCSLSASDGTPPNLQITSHSDMQLVPTNNIVLSGTASDAGSGDDGIAYVKVNGVRANGDSTSGSGTAAWSKAVILSDGLNTLNVTAADFAGNIASNTIHLISDSTRPTVSIIFPTVGLRVTNTPDPLIVRGRTSDNVQVTSVQFWLNSGPWTDVVTTNGYTNWTASIQPIARTNLIKAYSVDEAGNYSVTNALNFIYVVPSPLTLTTNGLGTITRSFAGNILEVGRIYSMTAVPGAGQVFYGWSGDLKSTNAALTFVMQSNMVLQANFIPNPFPKAAGTYYGLFAESNRAQNRSGFFTLSVGPAGGFSASLVRGTNTFPFSGGFDVYGMAYATAVSAGANSWNATMTLDLSGGDNISGTIGNDQWSADLLAYRALFNAATNPATQFAGKYTLIIPGSGVPNGSAPDGDSYAAVSVGPAGFVTASGFLSDSNALTQSIPISQNGDWPLYQSRYGGKGSVWGWLTLDPNNPSYAISGNVSWIKQAVSGAAYYPAGFTNLSSVSGSVYSAPTTNQVIALTNGIVVFDGGNLASAFTNDVVLTETNRVINDSANALSFIINLTNGTFSGKVQVPGTHKTNSFKGALLQGQALGSGFFLGTNQSGRVSLQPEP